MVQPLDWCKGQEKALRVKEMWIKKLVSLVVVVPIFLGKANFEP